MGALRASYHNFHYFVQRVMVGLCRAVDGPCKAHVIRGNATYEVLTMSLRPRGGD